MEKKNITLREPRLRVSRKFYIQVMENVLNEAVFLDHEEGMLLIYAVRAYLQTSRNAPGSGDRIYKLFRRYRDIIDRAAERSARARAAAQRRRHARLQSTPATETIIGRVSGNNRGGSGVISETDRKIRHGEFGSLSGNG